MSLRVYRVEIFGGVAVGRDIFCGKRGNIGHLRRRGASRNFTDAETLRLRAGDSFRENVRRILIAECADDFYPADIFNPVRRAA